MRRRVLLRLAAALALSGACAAVSSAQPRGKGPGRPPPAASAVERWNKLTPEQRKRALEKLPPDRRRRLEQRSEELNRLSPEERLNLEERYQKLQSLPPEKRETVRQAMLDFGKLRPERQQAVREEHQRMSQMSDDERRGRMESPEFRDSFNKKERQMLEDLSAIPPAP